MPLDTLDKNPGLIGLGEVLCRISAKVIVSVLKKDVIKCTGRLQVVHSMNMIYQDEKTDAILLVDASNGFSSLNIQSLLQYISLLSPSIPIFVKSCYSTPSRLFIAGGTEITLREATTQDDPVSMAI